MTATDPTLPELRQRHAELAERARLEREIQEYEFSLMMAPHQADCRKIVKLVCAAFPPLSPALIMSKTREEWVALPRQVCYWLAKRLLEGSFQAVGDFFGKDHGTIMYGCTQIDNRMKTKASFRVQMEELETEARKALDEGKECSRTK